MSQIYFKFKRSPLGCNSFRHTTNKSFWRKCMSSFGKKVCANPDFEDKIPYVAQWYVEYDEDLNVSGREIGLDADGKVIVKMPDERNYGFWLDTNMTIEDFKSEFKIQMITEREFDNLWNSVTYDIKTGKFFYNINQN